MAGYWIHPERNQIVKVDNTHDRWLRNRQHALDLGLPESAFQEIMSYAATEIDPIRMVGVRHGLVRVREHRRHSSVQHWTEADRAGSILAAVVRVLGGVVHPDERLVIDNLLTGESRAITLGGLLDELSLGTSPSSGAQAS